MKILSVSFRRKTVAVNKLRGALCLDLDLLALRSRSRSRFSTSLENQKCTYSSCRTNSNSKVKAKGTNVTIGSLAGGYHSVLNMPSAHDNPEYTSQYLYKHAQKFKNQQCIHKYCSCKYTVSCFISRNVHCLPLFRSTFFTLQRKSPPYRNYSILFHALRIRHMMYSTYFSFTSNYKIADVKSISRSFLVNYHLHRHYSYVSGEKNGNEIDNCENTEDAAKEVQSYADKLGKDPDVKAILDEMRSDFQENLFNNDTISTSDSSSGSDSSSSDDEDSNLGGEKPLKFSSNSTKNVKEEDFVYDYRYADDIEDFGYSGQDEQEAEEEKPEKIAPIPLTRGNDGVFDVDELLTFLNHLGAENIVTVDVPPDANYCDHMVITSAKSLRHLQFIKDEFLWMHKRKKGPQDAHLRIEGLDSSNSWCAMDLGNIVLHVFYGDAREYYDIESLWTLGPENDPKCQELHHDPLALSEEDLFWMEAAKMKEKDTVDDLKTNFQEEALSGQVPFKRISDQDLDGEAGWNDSKPKNDS